MNNKRNLKISRTWSFNNNVSKIFDKHVRQSIPLYDHFHKQVAKISEFYYKPESIVLYIKIITLIIMTIYSLLIQKVKLDYRDINIYVVVTGILF